MTNTNEINENQKKTPIKKIIAAGLAALVLFAGLLAVYHFWSAKPVAGEKAITIEVIDDAAASTVYTLNTDAEFLQGAMDEADGLTYSGTESTYGMVIDTVNGIYAEYTATGSYWAFYVNDEYCNYGISEQPVLDGDAFQITYTLAE